MVWQAAMSQIAVVVSFVSQQKVKLQGNRSRSSDCFSFDLSKYILFEYFAFEQYPTKQRIDQID